MYILYIISNILTGNGVAVMMCWAFKLKPEQNCGSQDHRRDILHNITIYKY